MSHDSYQLYGQIDIDLHTGLNQVNGKQKGKNCVKFSNTELVYYHQPPKTIISGTLYGDRQFILCGESYTFNFEHNLLCLINFRIEKKGMFFNSICKNPLKIEGGIYQVKNEVLDQIKKSMQNNEFIKIQFNPKKDAYKQISSVSGNWINNIQFDDQIYWQIDQQLPYSCVRSQKVLPSDSLFRMDKLYLLLKNEDEAQKYKDQYEQIQRNDKLLRKKN